MVDRFIDRAKRLTAGGRFNSFTLRFESFGLSVCLRTLQALADAALHVIY
jgi:hypothetical protein